jgi:hypothetical protein
LTVDSTQRHAACRFVVVAGQKKLSVRRCVLTRQGGEFIFELILIKVLVYQCQVFYVPLAVPRDKRPHKCSDII